MVKRVWAIRCRLRTVDLQVQPDFTYRLSIVLSQPRSFMSLSEQGKDGLAPCATERINELMLVALKWIQDVPESA